MFSAKGGEVQFRQLKAIQACSKGVALQCQTAESAAAGATSYKATNVNVVRKHKFRHGVSHSCGLKCHTNLCGLVASGTVVRHVCIVRASGPAGVIPSAIDGLIYRALESSALECSPATA